MGIFQCKLSSLFVFPSFLVPVAVHPGLSAKVCNELYQFGGPLKSRGYMSSFISLLKWIWVQLFNSIWLCSGTSKFPRSISSWATCSVRCESWSWRAAATWILPNHWFGPQFERWKAKHQCYLWWLGATWSQGSSCTDKPTPWFKFTKENFFQNFTVSELTLTPLWKTAPVFSIRIAGSKKDCTGYFTFYAVSFWKLEQVRWVKLPWTHLKNEWSTTKKIRCLLLQSKRESLN